MLILTHPIFWRMKLKIGILTLATFVAMLTAFYMFRLLFLTFGGSFRGLYRLKEHR